jgi:hypothetical protein
MMIYKNRERPEAKRQLLAQFTHFTRYTTERPFSSFFAMKITLHIPSFGLVFIAVLISVVHARPTPRSGVMPTAPHNLAKREAKEVKPTLQFALIHSRLLLVAHPI